jgi:hypothetical protein
MITMTVLVCLTIAHQYLIQRDMIIIVIKKIMVLRQQTQLQAFFMNSKDPIIVASAPNS